MKLSNLKNFFGLELKQRIIRKVSQKEIGEWSFSFYMDNIREVDDNLRSILLNLNAMEMGEEFEYSYEELDKIANELIEGKEVKLK